MSDTISTTARVAGPHAADDRSSLLRRPLVAALALLALYGALSLLIDPNGSLGTDTGGKVATLEVMVARGDLDPDVGWWAAEWDPDAELHGLYYTSRVGDRYVNVTTLPMIVAAAPLYDLGGYRLALLLPMLGSLAAAFGARALSVRVVSGTARAGRPWWGDGWAAFWVVGAASPLLVYALDLWEHAIGAGLMTWAAVVLVDVAGARVPAWRAVLAGLALGASFAMRTESAAYAVGFFAVALLALARRRRSPVPALVAGVAGVAGFAAMVVANLGLERLLVGGSMRADRAAAAAGSGADEWGRRGEEAVITTAAFLADGADARLPVYVGFAALLCGAVWLAARRDRDLPARALGAVVAAVYLFVLLRGPGFVPGLLVTAPFAAVAAVLAWRRAGARLPTAMALVPLPLVWAFQYTGGAVPQWGGRYVLATTTVLVAVGVSCARDLPRWAWRGLLVASVAVNLSGVAWLVERSHEVARAGREVAARPEPVVVSEIEFWLREMGTRYPGSRWLTVRDDEDIAVAADLLRDAGYDEVVFLSFASVGPPEVPGWVAGEGTETTWVGTRFLFTPFERAEPPADGS